MILGEGIDLTTEALPILSTTTGEEMVCPK
jgi:hypothetical protein